MKQAIICPVCNSREVDVFLQRKNVVVHQHLLMESPVAARNAGRGDLTLARCLACEFIFNHTFEQGKLCYGECYESTQTFSGYFNNYVDELINYLIEEKGIRNCSIVEIGCGQGAFLQRLTAGETSNRGYGFDPSYRGPAATADGRVSFMPAYYEPGCSKLKADVVICRHVIEHVSRPVALLKAMKEILGPGPQARIFLETPTVEWILRNDVFWDFFYEHCSYFSAGSLTRAVQEAGLHAADIKEVFNGQYLWLEAVRCPENGPAVAQPAVAGLAERFSAREKEFIDRWRQVIAVRAAPGKIALWGAGAKGVTFVNILDPACKHVDCVVDINPAKQGKYLPGTGHPIVAPAALPERGIASVILLNPNYRREVAETLRDLSAHIALLEVEDGHENQH